MAAWTRGRIRRGWYKTLRADELHQLGRLQGRLVIKAAALIGKRRGQDGLPGLGALDLVDHHLVNAAARTRRELARPQQRADHRGQGGDLVPGRGQGYGSPPGSGRCCRYTSRCTSSWRARPGPGARWSWPVTARPGAPRATCRPRPTRRPSRRPGVGTPGDRRAGSGTGRSQASSVMAEIPGTDGRSKRFRPRAAPLNCRRRPTIATDEQRDVGTARPLRRR